MTANSATDGRVAILGLNATRLTRRASRCHHHFAGVIAGLGFLGGGAGGQTVPAKTAISGDLGFVSASGNTRLTTLSLGDKVVRTDGRWVVSQLAAYIYGETNQKVTANQVRVAGRGDLAFNPRLGVFAGPSFERNTFAGFRRRTDEIAGLKWKAIVAPFDSLSLDGGGVLTQETNVAGSSRSYPSARAAAAYKHSFSSSAYFTQLAEYVPNLQASDERRLNTESAIVAPLSSHVGMKGGYIVRFNSKPPVGFGKTDRVLTTGIQVSF